MTDTDIQTRLAEVRSRMNEIDSEFAGKALPEELRSEFEDLVSERKELERLDAELSARKQAIEDAAERDEAIEAPMVRKPRARGEEVYDLSTVRASVNNPAEAVREMKERAKYAIESGNFVASSVGTEEAQRNALELIEKKDHHGSLARRFLETGSPEYERAFGKAVMGKPLSDAEQRALSTTTTAGGYAIPFTLDPSVIHTSAQSVNPFRSISRVVQTTTNNWHGISSADVSAAYGTEAAEASDGAPSFSQPSISPLKASAFVPYSIEIDEDWAGLQAEITSMIQEAKDDLEATKFAFGTGTVEPKGIVVAATATVNTAGTAAFAIGDTYKLEEALPPRHRVHASWIANRSIYNRVRQFDTAGGAGLWTENLRAGLANQVPTPGGTGYNLLGYPTYEASTMGTALASGGTVAVLGDFSKFVIVDRIGMNVELIPHLFGSSNRFPTGQRGLYAYWRNSTDVVDALAFRKLLTL